MSISYAAITWPKEIANGSHKKPREETSGDRGNTGVSYILSGEIKVISNDGDKRSSSESRNEASEDRDPSKMVSSHVRSCKGEEFEYFGYILCQRGERILLMCRTEPPEIRQRTHSFVLDR
uniref:Uncharacterized protein n=2 Tax=Noccaea caerulescens TaxID=107243 RepID=A0A1J3ITS5_NOCCA